MLAVLPMVAQEETLSRLMRLALSSTTELSVVGVVGAELVARVAKGKPAILTMAIPRHEIPTVPQVPTSIGTNTKTGKYGGVASSQVAHHQR